MNRFLDDWSELLGSLALFFLEPCSLPVLHLLFLRDIDWPWAAFLLFSFAVISRTSSPYPIALSPFFLFLLVPSHERPPGPFIVWFFSFSVVSLVSSVDFFKERASFFPISDCLLKDPFAHAVLDGSILPFSLDCPSYLRPAGAPPQQIAFSPLLYRRTSNPSLPRHPCSLSDLLQLEPLFFFLSQRVTSCPASFFFFLFFFFFFS